MTTLDEILLKNVEKYDLKNNAIPKLMQRYPWIADIGFNALKQNINLTMVEDASDYIYFILGILADEATRDMTDIDMGMFFDKEKFFELLEDYLILIFEIKKVESILLSKRYRRVGRKKFVEEMILEDVVKKLGLKPNIFDLMGIKTHKSNIAMMRAEKLFVYNSLLKNAYKERK